jgi:predicted HicB family RNase H-like nuclease
MEEGEPQVKLEEGEKVALAQLMGETVAEEEEEGGQSAALTVDERRFLHTCRILGEKPHKKYHYGVLGVFSAFLFWQ